MSYRISETLVENSSEALEQISSAIRRGEAIFFNIPSQVTPQTCVYNFHSLLASARFYDELGYGHLRDACSVALDYDRGQVVIYPREEGKWNKPSRKDRDTSKDAAPGQVTTGGTLRDVHDAYADFRNSDTKETQLKFQLPDDWNKKIEGMGGKTGEDLFRLACKSDGIATGEMTIHTEDDDTRWASCYVVKESVTKRRQELGGGFDKLGEIYDTD